MEAQKRGPHPQWGPCLQGRRQGAFQKEEICVHVGDEAGLLNGHHLLFFLREEERSETA